MEVVKKMNNKNQKIFNENIIHCLAKTYFEALEKKNDSPEPRSLILRGKTDRNYKDIDVFISFILLVENAFFSLDRVHQNLIDREFFEQKKFDRYLYPSSTFYRLRKEAMEQFLSFIGIFGQSSKQITL